jgi:hypothetical protein
MTKPNQFPARRAHREMYLVVFLDQNNTEHYFTTSLHTTFAGAVAEYERLLRRYILEPFEAIPPKGEWSSLCDENGEGVHIYQIEPDGEPGEEIVPKDIAA